eukprot:m.364915 g.364915  ORF g.364915 m.364915 type:complete len:68 (+) comp28979_c0_seq1:87-290(+)
MSLFAIRARPCDMTIYLTLNECSIGAKRVAGTKDERWTNVTPTQRCMCQVSPPPTSPVTTRVSVLAL